MEIKLVEIARSYSQKCNTENYESKDFFCSQKLEVPESEAEEASKRAFDFCYKQVQDDIQRLSEEAKKPKFKSFKPMTADEWESLSVEEQEKLQGQKNENNRAVYQTLKPLGKIKRKTCENCGDDHFINVKKCPNEEAVYGVGDQRGSKYGDK